MFLQHFVKVYLLSNALECALVLGLRFPNFGGRVHDHFNCGHRVRVANGQQFGYLFSCMNTDAWCRPNMPAIVTNAKVVCSAKNHMSAALARVHGGVNRTTIGPRSNRLLRQLGHQHWHQKQPLVDIVTDRVLPVYFVQNAFANNAVFPLDLHRIQHGFGNGDKLNSWEWFGVSM